MRYQVPIAIVFDMDECIGTWSYSGIFYGILQYLNVDKGKRAVYLYTKHLLPYIIRPTFVKCMKMLDTLKLNNIIQDVVIYTSNTGVGYPEFIKKCLENYANTPGLFTKVLVTHKSNESDKQGFKNLNCLTTLVNSKYKPPFLNVICFDDRVDVWAKNNGSRARVVKVPVFNGDPDINIDNLIIDIFRYYKINDIYLTLSRRIGDITYFTNTPNKKNTVKLFQLLNNFQNRTQYKPNYNDLIVKQLFIPNIRNHIKSLKTPSYNAREIKPNNNKNNKNKIKAKNVITITTSGRFKRNQIF